MKETGLLQLEKKLFEETDGNKFSKIKDKLLKNHAQTNREETLLLLTQYVKTGQIIHWRNFLLTDIIKLIKEDEKYYFSFFQWAITIPELAYWSIDGLLKTDKKASYPLLVDIIQQEKISTETKAKAIKSISIASKQTFDRNLVADPGYWKPEDLRIQEIINWQKEGYPDGKGHQAPETHPSLENPTTALEKLAARLDKKLEKKRAKHQYLSNPTNWLAIANEEDIAAIEKKWELPSNYLHFLTYYSPIKVDIYSKNFFQGLHLYNASNLITSQAGYSYNGVTHEKITDWPSNYVVIADNGGDPYCIDIENIHNGDAPIYTSIHGSGKWDFEPYADRFTDFLKEIIKI